VPAGAEKNVQIALAKLPPPPPPMGTLALRVSPANALLSLDGNKVGSAADFHQEVSAGNHDVEISAEGYQSQRQTVAVPAGAEKNIQIALAKLPPPPPPMGTLALQVSPANALLSLDGNKVGSAAVVQRIGMSGPRGLFQQEVPAGTHEVELMAEGYQTHRETVTVPAGGEKSMAFSLTRIPPPSTVRPPPRARPEPVPTREPIPNTFRPPIAPIPVRPTYSPPPSPPALPPVTAPKPPMPPP
jgi:hypothetical protein